MKYRITELVGGKRGGQRLWFDTDTQEHILYWVVDPYLYQLRYVMDGSIARFDKVVGKELIHWSVQGFM
jgi:hypothetical protein